MGNAQKWHAERDGLLRVRDTRRKLTRDSMRTAITCAALLCFLCVGVWSDQRRGFHDCSDPDTPYLGCATENDKREWVQIENTHFQRHDSSHMSHASICKRMVNRVIRMCELHPGKVCQIECKFFMQPGNECEFSSASWEKMQLNKHCVTEQSWNPKPEIRGPYIRVPPPAPPRNRPHN